jgi:hypothetical protein
MYQKVGVSPNAKATNVPEVGLFIEVRALVDFQLRWR